MSLNIVFMGTPEFSDPTLDALIKNKFNVFKVYTQPPKKSKRGQKVNQSPIEEFCKKNKISFSNPPNLNSEEELKIFKKLSPDIVVVVSYGQIIPKSFLDFVKFGFINIHASLLPKWRGAAPIQRAIMNGDKKIGVSIMKIKEKLDSGPVLTSKEIQLDQNETYGENLARCQRYFQSHAANGASYIPSWGAASYGRFSGQWPVTMRAAPSLTLPSLYIATGTVDNFNGYYNHASNPATFPSVIAASEL